MKSSLKENNIALCLMGLVGGKAGKSNRGGMLDPNIASRSIKRHVVDANANVDVFIHSWDTSYQEQLIDLYKPKSYRFEPKEYFIQHSDVFQDRFRKCLERDIEKYKTQIKRFHENIVKKPHKTKRYQTKIRRASKSKGALEKNIDNKINLNRVNDSYCRWNSTKRVIDLKKDYEEENGFVYNWVMVCRLDVMFFVDLLFGSIPKSSSFYVSHFRDGERGNMSEEQKRFMDFWFFACSPVIDLFSTQIETLNKMRLECVSRTKTIDNHALFFRFVKKMTDDIKYFLYYPTDYDLVRHWLLNNE